MFEIGFDVEVDPEFPPDEGVPIERIPPDLPRIGAILRLSPPDAPPWDIAIGAPNWWRTPISTAIAFISDLTGYLVDVAERRILLKEEPVTRIWQAQESGLLLMVSFDSICAVGSDGVAWRSGRLAYDDLKVVASNREQIVCRGLVEVDDLASGIHSEISVDPRTGEQRSGPRFRG